MSFIKNPFVLTIIAALCGSSVPIVAKPILGSIDPILLNFLRFFFATIFLFPFVNKKEITKNNLKNLAIVGIVGAINPLIFIIALQYTDASVAPLMYSIVPALTALYIYTSTGTHLSLKQILGIILGFVGVAFITILPILETYRGGLALYGNVLFLGAALTFTIYGILSKKLQTKIKVSPLTLTFIFCMSSLIISFPFLVMQTPQSHNFTFLPVVISLFMGIVGTGLFYISYQYALQKGSAITASLFLYLQPLITAVLAILFLGEKITVPLFIGGVVALIGARLASEK